MPRRLNQAGRTLLAFMIIAAAVGVAMISIIVFGVRGIP